MKTLIVIVGTVLFTASQVYGGSNKLNAQSLSYSAIKEEPKTVTLKITGMTCSGCNNHVASALKSLDGVVEQKVEYPGDVAIVEYKPSKTSVEAIINAIEKLGYKAVVSENTTEKKS